MDRQALIALLPGLAEPVTAWLAIGLLLGAACTRREDNMLGLLRNILFGLAGAAFALAAAFLGTGQ